MSRLLFLSIGSFWLRIAAFACLVLMTSLGAAHAKPKLPLITLLHDCEPKSACLIADIDIADANSRQVELLDESICGHFVIEARGRLNGGPIKGYRVAFAGDCFECSSAKAALVGSSAAGKPIFLSSAGRFEFLGKGVTVGDVDGLYVVHARTGEIVAKYWTPILAGRNAAFGKDGRVFVTDHRHTDGRCFVATRSIPRSFTAAPGRCDDAATRDLKLVEEVIAAADDTLRILNGNAYHVVGTELLAVTFGDACH